MAIWIDGYLVRQIVGDDGRLSQQFDGLNTIDLGSGKVSSGSECVMYAPSDVKKLARARKISFVECVDRYFRRVGVDDSKGALIFVAKSAEERKEGS